MMGAPKKQFEDLQVASLRPKEHLVPVLSRVELAKFMHQKGYLQWIYRMAQLWRAVMDQKARVE